MMPAVQSIIALLLLALSAWGWGKFFARWAGVDEEGWAYPAALGLAALIALGGAVNLLGAARAPALVFLAAAGWILAWRRRASGPPIWHWADAPSLAGFAAHAIFLSPSAYFNSHDDFHLYLPDPARMLATGTLGGDPFGWLGSNAQGAQGFLQSFVLMARPFTHIYAFDAALCLALAMGLAAQLARRLGARPAVGAAAAACVLLIPPQVVNASALYSAGALSLALVLAALPLARDWRVLDAGSAARRASALGLLSAALIALKMTMAPPAILFIVCLLVFLAMRKGRGRALAAAGGAAAAAAAALLPWLLTHGGIFSPHSLSIIASEPGTADAIPSLWSELSPWTPRYYGGSLPISLAFAALLLLAAARALRDTLSSGERLAAAAFCAASAALLPAYLMLHARFGLLDLDGALRYWAPVSLAAVPAGVILLSLCLASKEARSWGWAVLAALALPLASPFAARMKRLFLDRTVISYPYTQDSLRGMNGFLSGRAAARLRAAQADVPAGETVLAWISAPFYLDFSRNRLFIVSEGALTSPRFDWLDRASPDEAAERLRRLGIRYVLWQRHGLGVKSEEDIAVYLRSIYGGWRRTGERQMSLRRALLDVAARGRVLRDDDGLLLIELPKPATSAR